MSKILQIFLLSVVFFAASCRDDVDCSTSAIDFISVSFADSGTFEARMPRFDTAFVLSENIGFISLGDSLDTLFFLPINPFATEETYVFVGADRNGETQFDTIEFSYFPRQGVISPECGGVQFFDNLDTISTTFDSLVITQPQIRDFNAQNVRIFN